MLPMRFVCPGLIWVPLIMLVTRRTLASIDATVTNDVKALEYQHDEYLSSHSKEHRYGEGIEVLLAASQLLESVDGLVESECSSNSCSAVTAAVETRIVEGRREPECTPTTAIGNEEEDGYEYDEQPTPFTEHMNAPAASGEEEEEALTATRTLDSSRAQSTRTISSAADTHHRDPKSLKGRFNFASADCAAVVLKANKEAKGQTAILNPKKDQYMLNECMADDKFVIVELCDDILIDTLVLGNYEFFSSTFKDTMVYVSDRYPPKNNTWTPLGHFQARNNRDAQVFPVHDPPIWAKYIRVDFLSHYGNEHYCPLTVFKVYGTTQMEQYRKEEDEEDFAETATLTVEALVGSPLRDYQFNFPYHQQQHQRQQLRIDGNAGSPAKAFLRDIQGLVNKFEERDDSEPQEPVRQGPAIPKVPNLPWDRQDDPSNNSPNNSGDIDDDDEYDEEEDEDEEGEGGAGESSIFVAADIDTHIPDMKGEQELPQHNIKDGTDNVNGDGDDATNGGGPVVPPVLPNKHRGQESIFKTIMRRLLRVERNVTLAYRYLEEQHMVFNLVLQQVELNNLANVQLAIKQLNHTTAKQMQSLTTLSEEIWRAILYDLEEYQQKTQSEMSEMSNRLEYLAEEVLFEKRMNVAQLALLLIIVVMIAANKVVTKLALIPESKKEK